MSQPEHRLSSKILSAIRAEGAFAWKQWGNEMTMSGLPDVIGVIGGRFIGIETKMPAARLNVSPAQAYRMKQICAAGGAVKVCCSVQEAVEFVREVRDM